MGQIVKRKTKGRPPRPDPESPPPPDRDLRRSLRRRNVKYVFDLDDYFDEEELFDNDEDQRRREKKLKHLLKLQSGELKSAATPPQSRTRREEHAPGFSSSSSDGSDNPSKKRKIIDEIDEDMDDANDEENYNEENNEETTGRKQVHVSVSSNPGSRAGVLPGLLLPDKKTLELILDKLQKKDIYGVYAEPVDPEELPDYHDIIKHPMDFATVRKKLGNGSYETLEQFESDIFLICSNAMKYNAPDTIYHKQARSIKEQAIMKFHKIRLESGSVDKYDNPEQKLRSTPLMKKQSQSSIIRMQEPFGSDFSSASPFELPNDPHNVSNALQDGDCDRFGNSDALAEGISSFNENTIDKGDESLSGKSLLSRYGKKCSIQDENRRGTYSICPAQNVESSESMFSIFDGESKQLVPVGLYSDHSYARSLALFAATLGSVAWEITSKRIEQALPQGLKYGRGWVGDYEPLPTPVLILENCNIKEPPFFAKPKPAVKTKKYQNPCLPKPSLDYAPAQFLDHSGVSSPSSTRPNASDMSRSFFLSPRIKQDGSPSFGDQHEVSQLRTCVDSDKMVLKQSKPNVPLPFNRNAAESSGYRQNSVSAKVEARSMGLTSTSVNFSQSGMVKQRDDGVTPGALPNGKVPVGRLDSDIITGSSNNTMKAPGYYQHERGQFLNDPVTVMRMLSEKGKNQQQTTDAHPQVLSSAPSSSGNVHIAPAAAAAAARAWMSVGAGGFSTPNNHLSGSYNSPRDAQQIAQFHGELASAGGMAVQQDRNSSLLHAFVPQGPMPFRVGNGIQFQNQPMVYPQLNADLSRFQLQPTWRNLSPHMHSRQKQESSLPPDLNIGFQPSGSPGGPSSGQPDLALQL